MPLLVEAALHSHSRLTNKNASVILNSAEIIILNNVEEKENIIQDFVSIITSFCAKIYGQRRSKRNTEKLIKELQHD